MLVNELVRLMLLECLSSVQSLALAVIEVQLRIY